MSGIKGLYRDNLEFLGLLGCPGFEDIQLTIAAKQVNYKVLNYISLRLKYCLCSWPKQSCGFYLILWQMQKIYSVAWNIMSKILNQWKNDILRWKGDPAVNFLLFKGWFILQMIISNASLSKSNMAKGLLQLEMASIATENALRCTIPLQIAWFINKFFV